MESSGQGGWATPGPPGLAALVDAGVRLEECLEDSDRNERGGEQHEGVHAGQARGLPPHEPHGARSCRRCRGVKRRRARVPRD